jgi:hypothetical protein
MSSSSSSSSFFDSIIMGDTNCRVVYVDAIAAGGGDGNSPATALQDIPDANTMTNDTVYLCRRNVTNPITMYNSTKASGDNIFIIGMPKSTDWLYDRMPPAAKSAWDGDSDDYCLIHFETYNARMVFLDIDNFGCHRLWFVRINPGSGNGAYSSYANLHVKSSSSLGSYFFTNNKWTDSGVDLSDPGWNTNTTYHGATLYFEGGTATGEDTHGKSCRISDNHFQFNHRSAGGVSFAPSHFLGVYYFNDVVMNDNDFWLSSKGNNSYNYHMVRTIYIERAQASRNTIKLVAQDTASVTFDYLFYFEYIGEGIFTDNDVSVDRYYNLPGITQEYVYGCMYYHQAISPYGKFVVTDCSVDTDELQYYYGSPMITVYAYGGGSPQSSSRPESRVGNLSVRCNDVSAITTGSRWYSVYAMTLYMYGQITLVENITAHSYGGYGLYVESAGSYSKSPVMKNVSVKGKMTFVRVPFVEVTDWSTSRVENDLCSATHSSVYIASATLDDGSWTTEQWLFYSSSNNNHVIVDSINIPSYIHWSGIPTQHDGVWVNNVEGVSGKWQGDNYYYRGDTFNVYRTGGASASIKLTRSVVNSNKRIPLFIAPRPWRGLEWNPPSTGFHYAKMYIAHKLYHYPELLSKRMRMLVEVPIVGGGDYKTYCSDIDGQWEVDGSSVWNNDSGLTQMLCTVPFIVEDASELVTVRLLFDWYDDWDTGYLYLDPLIVFLPTSSSSSSSS